MFICSEDIKNDRELMALLHDHKVIEQYCASELHGKERRDYFKQKTQELGGKKQKIKMALPLVFHMNKKADKEKEKKVEDLKNRGLYTQSIKKQMEGEKKSKKRTQGLKGSVGKYKNGVLHIGKDVIDAANGKKSFKRDRTEKVLNRMGGDHRKRR
jgi:hypothetical protein